MHSGNLSVMLTVVSVLISSQIMAQPRGREIQWVNRDIAQMNGLSHHVLSSTSMKHDVGYVVWTPPNYDEDQQTRYPVVYFLHGAGGSEKSDSGGFSARVSAAILAERFPAAICVFPNGGMSGYRDNVESMIVDELIPLIDREYRTKSNAESRVICGFSMGGAGSVFLSVRHPDLFCAAGSWGGALSFRGSADESPLLATAKENAALLKKHHYSLLTINGDQDRPDAFDPLRSVLMSHGIQHQVVTLKDTNHNLGKYYELGGDTMLEFLAAKLSAAEPFRIEESVIAKSEGDFRWSQARPASLPGGKVIVTMQEIEKRGSHGYRDIYFTETTAGAMSWSKPVRIDALNRRRFQDGIERVMGDVCPQWHERTGKLLLTAKTFGFLFNPNDNKGKDDRSQERVAYSTYDPAKNVWSEMKIMAMPEKDHAGNPIIEPNAGCHQRVDLANGDILLPVRYRADRKSRVYTSIVTRCTFDGDSLAYVEHGSEHTFNIPRGLYEPSVCKFKNGYYLTMRGELNGHVTRSDDGLNYAKTIQWKFDDGQPLLSANAQQHWITHGEHLYLIYSRKGANNDHVFRNRAPIFIAEVDSEKLCVIRASERVLMSENGLDLTGGFAPVEVSPAETWIVSSEMGFPDTRKDENNRVRLAKIIWKSTTEQ